MADLAAILRARRALTRAAGLRVPKTRKIHRQAPPAAARVMYQRQLTAMRRTMEALVREVLIPALPDLLAQANRDRGGVREDSATEDLFRIFEGMILQFRSAHPLAQVIRTVTEVGESTNVKQSMEHQKQMTAGLGVPLIIPEPFVQASMQHFIADNQDLVESLFGRELQSFKTITSAGIRGGLRVETIRDQLIKQVGMSKAKAALLARDQTLKLAGELTGLRQQNSGISEYDWDTSGDERVRERHAQLHGTRQKWKEPPIVDERTERRASPGGDYQCRCQGIPVMPDFLLAEAA